MQSGARLQAAIELLEDTMATSMPVDRAAFHYFRNRRFIGSKDRHAIRDLIYGYMNDAQAIDWCLTDVGLFPSPRLRIFALKILRDGMAAEELAQECGGKFAPPRLIREEEIALPQLVGRRLDDERIPLPLRLNCPPDLITMLEDSLEGDFVTELLALKGRAPFDLRVNPLKATIDEMISKLAAGGIKVSPTPFAPFGLRVEGNPKIDHFPWFKKGLAEVQGEASQIAAMLCDARPGMKVLDYCAGAGGKSLALAAAMKNKGQLILGDVEEGRLKRAMKRLQRAGVSNHQPICWDEASKKWQKRHHDFFDRVLIDAPCSGTGTWWRNPDLRSNYDASAVARLTEIQREILEEAAKLVKPGGLLIYATCSLLTAENEKQIEWFLEAHPEFALLPIQTQWQNCGGDGAHFPSLSSKDEGEGEDRAARYLITRPAHHNLDGFFAAVMQRS